MSTDQYTPDELEFIDKALVGIATGYLSDLDVPASWPEFVRRDALALLEARRKIRGVAQPTQTAPIANDELAVHEPVCNENMIRGVFFWEGGLTDTRGGIQVEYNSNEGIGMNQIQEKLGLNQGDIVEIRVLERADQ